jgi:glycosyltransferase involved in cell wall biosynthesis
MAEKYHIAFIKYYCIDFGRLKPASLNSIFSLLKSINAINKIIKKENIDLIVSNTVRANIVASFAASLTGRKLVWFIRDFTFPHMLFKTLSFFPKKIIFNAEAVKNFYVKNYDSDKYRVVYIGRNFYKLIQLTTEKLVTKQRSEWGDDKNDFFVGYVGRLVYWKGPQVLIAAINELVKNGVTNIKAIIVGSGFGQDGNNEIQLIDNVRNLKIEKNVLFLNFQKNLTSILPSLNVVALTSIEPEPFSSVVVDAMMARVPVIGTDIGGTPEIVENNRTGFLVKPDDYLELSRVIKMVCDNKVLAKEVAENAYKKVMIFHTARHTSEKIIKIYFEVLNVK